MLESSRALPPDPCGPSTFVNEVPRDASGTAIGSMTFLVRAALVTAGTVALGVGVGATVEKDGKHRGRNGAIGGLVGAVAGAMNAYREYASWRARGGATNQPGACDTTRPATTEAA